MKKIGVIGSGTVGKTLANGFLKKGYSVMIGSRDAEKLATWKQAGGENAHLGTPADAAAFGDIVVIAVKGEAAESAVQLAGYANLKGKTVIDTTNPIDHSKAPANGVLALFTKEESLLELLQKLAPEAHFVKAFSCVGNAYMVDPDFPQGKPSMFICGNSDKAKAEVTTVLQQFGWNAEDMGMAESARAIEPLVQLWCAPGLLRGQWSHAFALFKK